MEKVQKSEVPDSFGGVRRFMLEVVTALRNEEMDISRGMAIAANFKVFNDNIQAEVAATKLSLACAREGQNFGQVAVMGRRLIAEAAGDRA